MANLELPYYARAAAVGPDTKKAEEPPKPAAPRKGALREAMTEHLPTAESEKEPEAAKPRFSALRSGGSGRLSASVVGSGSMGKEGAGEGESWTMTYMDLVTLLLAFLVTLAVLADFSVPRTKEPGVAGETKEQGLETDPRGPQLINNIDKILRSSQFTDNVDVEIEDGKIVLRLRERLMFSSGAAGLSQDGADLLDMLVPVLLYDKTAISVEGHTDNVPIAGAAYTSNWELSSTRAIAVVEFLLGRGLDGGSMRAVGYADTMPLADNATAEGRARNRRVSLVIEPQGGF